MFGRDNEIDIIEVLAPDDPAWGQRTTPAVTAPPPARSRRLLFVGSAVAAVAVSAVVVRAVVDDPTTPVGVTPTTIALTPAPDSRLTPDLTQDPRDAGHFVLDNPHLRPYSLDVLTPPSEQAAFTIWATDEPAMSATGLPWVSVQAVHGEQAPYAFVDAQRRVLGDLELVSPGQRPWITDVVVQLGDGWSATVHAVRLTDDEIVQVADGIVVDDATPTVIVADGHGTLATLGMQVVASGRQLDEVLYGAVTTEMRSLTLDGELVTLRVAGDTETSWQAPLQMVADNLDGADDGFVVGAIAATGESAVWWNESGHRLSLTGRTTVEALLSFARTVRIAGDDEWNGLLYGLHPDYRLGDFAVLAQGSSKIGQWSAGVQVASRDHRTRYLWWWTRPDVPTESVSVEATVGFGAQTVVVHGATYVFVTVPQGADGTAATVVAADGSTTVVPLTAAALGDGSLRAGATRVDVPGPITVTFDGTVDVTVPF